MFSRLNGNRWLTVILSCPNDSLSTQESVNIKQILWLEEHSIDGPAAPRSAMKEKDHFWNQQKELNDIFFAYVTSISPSLNFY